MHASLCEVVPPLSVGGQMFVLQRFDIVLKLTKELAVLVLVVFLHL